MIDKAVYTQIIIHKFVKKNYQMFLLVIMSVNLDICFLFHLKYFSEYLNLTKFVILFIYLFLILIETKFQNNKFNYNTKWSLNMNFYSTYSFFFIIKFIN